MARRTPIRPTDLGTVLSIWAHPDDETYLAGATMAAAADAGQRVVCVSMTAGELGTSDPTNWPPHRLGRLRRWEAAAAMAVLGVADHRIVGLPDGGLAAIGDGAGTDIVADLLDEVRPDSVLTFGPDGQTFHPDHLAVHRWVTSAWHRRGCREGLLQAVHSESHLATFGARYEDWGIYMSDERPAPVADHELALRCHPCGAALDRKVAALAAMASQTESSRRTLGPDAFAAMIADEAFVLATAAP